MIPQNPIEDCTPGERKVWEAFSRLPDSFIAWQSLRLGRYEIDFLLYTPKNGLILFEVKDWAIDQILGANQQEAILRIGSRVEQRTGPVAQAGRYLNELKNLNLKNIVSHQCGVILTNIRRDDLAERLKNDPGIANIVNPEKALFRDDLARFDCADPGAWFQKILDNRFRPYPQDPDAAFRESHVCRLFGRPLMALPALDRSSAQRIVSLDDTQSEIATGLRARHTLVTGSAGTGKTLVLAAKAAQIYRIDPRKRILFLCFNLSLVNQIKRLIAMQRIPLGSNGVEVLNFYELTAGIVGEKVEQAESADYYEVVRQAALQELEAGGNPLSRRWDALMVDEGQDFTADMAAIATGVVKENGIITVAQDEAQNLYGGYSEDTWSCLADPERHVLGMRYRCTRQIMKLAYGQLGTLPEGELGITDGPEPEVRTASSLAEAAQLAASGMAVLRDRGMAPGSMCVLSRYGKADTMKAVVTALEDRALCAAWASRNESTKRGYDITTDSVTVSTIHSMKGMDFEHVVLLYPKRLADTERHPAERRNLYVAMTRARTLLTVIYYDEARAS